MWVLCCHNIWSFRMRIIEALRSVVERMLIRMWAELDYQFYMIRGTRSSHVEMYWGAYAFWFRGQCTNACILPSLLVIVYKILKYTKTISVEALHKKFMIIGSLSFMYRQNFVELCWVTNLHVQTKIQPKINAIFERAESKNALFVCYATNPQHRSDWRRVSRLRLGPHRCVIKISYSYVQCSQNESMQHRVESRQSQAIALGLNRAGAKKRVYRVELFAISSRSDLSILTTHVVSTYALRQILTFEL